jgi:hypothetical protein
MTPAQFLEKQHEEFLKFRSALSKETDRGCALFASSYLEKALSDLIYCALAFDKNIEKDLFSGTTPLATFSSRIKIAYYLGKISKVEKRDLELIRKIRNEFAHSADPIDFETHKIKSQCSELSFSYHDKNHRGRGHFTAACTGLLVNIQKETLMCNAPEIKPDNAPTEEQKEKNRLFVQKLSDDSDNVDA